MKKLIALFLSVVLFAFPVFAADLDLSSLSDEELLAISSAVQAELKSRNISEENCIKKGAYVVGTDIAAGSYVLTGTLEGEEYTDVYVYASMDDYHEYHSLESNYLKGKESVNVQFTDGTVVYFSKDTLIEKTSTPFAP